MADGRVALVTGAGRGIGAAVAHELARRGARVALLARTAAQVAGVADEIERAGGAAVAVPGDVSERESVRAAVTATEQAFGPVDILVNNAAVTAGLVPLLEQDPQAVDTALHVNVRGAWNCLVETVPGMVERGWGRVVGVGSSAGTRGIPTLGLYSATKSAFELLHETLAAEIPGRGVLVNVLWPGGVDTDMQAELREDGFAFADVAREAHRGGALRGAGEVAPRIADLCGDDVDQHGRRIVVPDRNSEG